MTGIKSGTVGGTLLTVAGTISSGDLIHMVILASVGAVVSFVVSVTLRLLFKKWMGKPPP